ncbi:MAG: response regulator [Deltaproteobacteria bacterium]|nr:response regulator [Deltaproteobacteria bacterium]
MRFRAAVLVIDDEPGMREMLSYELAQEGFEVETAESGMAAVEAVKRRRFDLAVTDLKMPGMDGVATVEALRSLDPDLEVIVGTGYATVETAVACMKRGAYDYIQKPYDLTELKVLLERAMQKSHLQGAVALYEASRALLATLKHAELVQLVVGLAHRVLRADDAGLVLWEGTGELALHRSTTSPLHDGVFVELARAVATSGGPMAVSEANLLAGRIHTDGAPLPTMALPDAGSDAGLQSALVYPLVGKERHLGALVLLRREGSPAFAQTELQRGAVFANQLTLSLDNARLFEALERKVQELVDTQEQLLRAEKLALAGHLAGAVAHEINAVVGRQGRRALPSRASRARGGRSCRPASGGRRQSGADRDPNPRHRRDHRRDARRGPPHL